jgi:A/G-specific adenine glycosylase
MPSPPAARLLAWYDAHRRDLPWRRDRDPYRVWVSEIMLQQTRVETVLPYYARFLERFPDVRALAAAPLDDLLARWSGLGYYRRARRMHAAARQVVDEHGGRFPESAGELRGLPGIGAYTAAAVASICFGAAEPVMDGNVERLAARLLAEPGDPKARGPRARLVAAAAALLDPARPGDGNQALMELGATVCTPRSPRCQRCPLREPGRGPGLAGEPRYEGCRALAAGDPEAYPPPRRRRPTERQRRLLALVEREGRLLLFRRSEDSGLMPGLWELPWVELGTGEGGEGEPPAPPAALARRYGGRWKVGRRLAGLAHGITYHAIEIDLHRAEVAGTGALTDSPLEAGWFTRDQLRSLPLSSLVTKALARAEG